MHLWLEIKKSTVNAVVNCCSNTLEYLELRGSRYPRKFCMGYQRFAWGTGYILGNFEYGSRYPRKFCVQDATFPDLEGVPHLLEGYHFS